MMFWKYARIPFLVVISAGTLWMLGKIIWSPDYKQQQADAIFPDQVPLSGWQLLQSKPLTDPPGKTYQYKQGKTYLTIEMRYVSGLSNNEKPFRDYDPTLAKPISSSKLPPILRRQDEVGYYGLSVQDGKAYLRSCINPRGGAAITYGQFIQNRYTVDLQPNRIIPWLIGQVPLRDYRCFWAHLSIPFEGNSPDTIYQVLENQWSTWYKFWHSKFPNQ